jgi:dTDP-4-dehydrorhamnose reductase
MNKTILIIGANGMLAADMTPALVSAGYDVIGTDLPETDITNFERTDAFIRGVNPGAVVNCAAFTQVDKCETEEQTAYAVNARGVKHIAEITAKLAIPFLHISTDYVFDGTKGEVYCESDEANPLSAYGRTKLAGERFALSVNPKSLVVRTQWLYGAAGPNFVKTMLKLFTEQGGAKVVNDQFGSPTFTKDLAAACAVLLKSGETGLFHITNAGVMSWFDFAVKILSLSGLRGVSLTPCPTAEFPRPAKRPAYSPLKNERWINSGHEPLRPCAEALAEYMSETRDS